MSKNHTECGPYIACGAATISINHDPSVPTSIDKFAAALKSLFTGKHDRIATSGMEGTAAKSAI